MPRNRAPAWKLSKIPKGYKRQPRHEIAQRKKLIVRQVSYNTRQSRAANRREGEAVFQTTLNMFPRRVPSGRKASPKQAAALARGRAVLKSRRGGGVKPLPSLPPLPIQPSLASQDIEMAKRPRSTSTGEQPKKRRRQPAQFYGYK